MADLRRYFTEDDGTLPEVVVRFDDPEVVVEAFAAFFEWGARNVTVGGGSLWLADAAQAANAGDEVLEWRGEGFHVVLADIDCGGRIPDLGILVIGDCLTIDYRMGRGWHDDAIAAFVELLRRLRGYGGLVTVPWWGGDGERDFLAALDEGQRIH
jgi:hypothetical protein